MYHNPSADGLRGFAALNVVFAHFVAAFLPNLLHYNYPTVFKQMQNPSMLYEIVQFPLISIIYNGHLAVIIFFVLSGYVLTISAFNNNYEAIKKRLWGRYLRLNIPIICSLIFAYILLKYNLFYNIQASEISNSIGWLNSFYNKDISFSEFISLLFYKSIILGNSYLNPPLWTIKIELIGSLFLLIFYIVKSNINIKRDVIMMLILFIFLYIMYHETSIYFYAMFIGSLLNYFKVVSKKKVIAFLIIGIYFGAFQYNSYYNYLPNIVINNYEIFIKKDFYNTIGAIFIVISVINGGGKILFSSKLGLYLGKVSYSMYLLHMIVLCSLSSFIYISFPEISKMYLLLNLLTYLLIVIFLSHIFTKYVDKLAINISHKFSNYLFKDITK